MTADRIRRVLIAAGTSAWLCAGSAGAAIPRHPAAPPQGWTGGDAVVARAIPLAQGGDCKAALTLLDPLVAANSGIGPVTRFSAQLLRMPCLAGVGRGAEVAPVLAELKAKAPTNPLVLGFEVFTDADAGRYAEAADRLGVIADQRSRALTLVPGSLWRALSQKLTFAGDTQRRDRVALALALADWDPADRPELAESLAVDGIGALLDQQAIADAEQLLPRVQRPNLLWEMAIERRYAALWPAIEARMGPAGGTAIDAYARTALDAYASAPQDPRATRDAAYAFLFLGRFDDVASVAGSTAIAPGMGEEQVGTVIVDAEALAAAGQRDRALDRLQPFARLDFKTAPDAVGALIAYAEQLDEAGRYSDELAVATAPAAISALSSYGAAWLRRNQVCALAGLKRSADEKSAGDALKASAKDNQAAAIEGLLCAGRDDEAATIAIAALATPEGADRLADQLQPDGALLPHPPSHLRTMWARLLARPDVKAAFDRAARILPKVDWPASTPRPLPPPGADDGTTTT